MTITTKNKHKIEENDLSVLEKKKEKLFAEWQQLNSPKDPNSLGKNLEREGTPEQILEKRKELDKVKEQISELDPRHQTVSSDTKWSVNKDQPTQNPGLLNTLITSLNKFANAVTEFFTKLTTKNDNDIRPHK
ncbi:MAG: hypothetical protein HYX60_07835 [Legionella longbeachae]|nr:hypothetical protein [Legionella longbeachae]